MQNMPFRGLSPLFVAAVSVSARPRVVGWYDMNKPPLSMIPWDIYTHIRYGAPVVNASTGACSCNNDNDMHDVVSVAHAHGAKVLWAPGIDAPANATDAYWRTIGDAMDECGIDGIEVAYEHVPDKWGIATPERAGKYTAFLHRLRATTGRPVSADVSVWGIAPGNYVLGALPWVNVTALNLGAFDWVNLMSYHYNRYGDILAWKKDLWFALKMWKIDPSRVSLGIPYFTNPHQHTWGAMSQQCPNVSAGQNTCGGEVFVGKRMNCKIGRIGRNAGVGGFFPWALSYDDYYENNTLSKHLMRGWRGEKC